jgi:V/A-type H+-transporting ATPase subunit I
MRWREAMVPERMSRVAVVARTDDLRAALVQTADSAAMEVDRLAAASELPVTEASQALHRLAPASQPSPRLVEDAPDVAELEARQRADLLAGEVELAGMTAQAVVRGDAAAVIGWVPTAAVSELSQRLAGVGAAAVEVARPRGVQPPTAAPRARVRRTFGPLVDTYGQVPYADVDPTILAGLSYAVMFGAMFGDVGHGALLVALALLIRFGRVRRLATLRPHWIFVAVAGACATAFGFAYGECFGPTGIVGPGLLRPMEQPVEMLALGIAIGAVLLGGAYALGTINRFREGGWPMALYAPAGIAGSLLFVAAGLGVAALYLSSPPLGIIALAVAAIGLVLAFVGFLVGAGGGAGGAAQASVQTLDVVIRLGANVASFARLAAFGLTHAVLGWIVWQATSGLWSRGPVGAAAAVAVFGIGTALAFTIEVLVAAVQALRLEYYELFSRVFQLEGRPFHPWHVPIDRAASPKELPWPPGSSQPASSSDLRSWVVSSR